MPRKAHVPVETDFRQRGKLHVTRLECFSDCVFAFAVTLLVVSLEVPKSFSELLTTMKGMVAFGMCFAALFGLWSRHHTFFRRYALEDGVTKGLTALLLFIVLAYVYPLKFLTLVAVNSAFGISQTPGVAMFTREHEVEQVRGLFVLYGGGLCAISVIFYFFYRYALARQKQLELTEIEVYDTQWFAIEQLGQAAVPVIATTLACVVPPAYIGFAGFSYCLYGLAGYMHGTMHGKGRRMKLAELSQP